MDTRFAHGVGGGLFGLHVVSAIHTQLLEKQRNMLKVMRIVTDLRDLSNI